MIANQASGLDFQQLTAKCSSKGVQYAEPRWMGVLRVSLVHSQLQMEGDESLLDLPTPDLYGYGPDLKDSPCFSVWERDIFHSCVGLHPAV